MKVDPQGIVAHLRSSVRSKNRGMEEYLASEIVSWIAKTDDIEKEVQKLRAALRYALPSLERDVEQLLDSDYHGAGVRALTKLDEIRALLPTTPTEAP